MDFQNTKKDEISFEDINDFKFIFIVLFFLTITAYGFLAFNLTLTGDDWVLIYEPMNHLEWFLLIRRWGNVILWFLFHNDVFAPALTLFLSCGLIIFSGYTACKLFNIRNKFESFLFISLFLFTPILAEPFGYKHYHIAIGVSIFLVVFSLYIIKKLLEEKTTLKSILLSKYFIYVILMLTFSFGTSQGSALLFLCASFALLLVGLSNLKKIKTLIGESLIIFSIGIISLFLYLIISKIIYVVFKLTFEVPEGYAYSLVKNISDVTFTLKRFFTYFFQFLFREQHLWPLQVKLIFLFFLVLFTISFLFRSKIIEVNSKKNLKFHPKKFLFFFILFCLFFISPWLLGLFRTPVNTYRYNALLGIIMIYPFIIIYTINGVKNIKIRILLRILAVYIVISFVIFQNVASLATYTANIRDRHVASNILTKVELLNKNPDFKKLYILGNIRDKKQYPFKHGTLKESYPMGTSAVQWGVFNNQVFRLGHLMSLISYRDNNDFIGVKTDSITWRLLAEITHNNPGRFKKLLKDVNNTEIWPSKKSIVFSGDNVIVFLNQDSIDKTIIVLKRILK